MNKKIEIFTCYHKIYDIAKSDVIVPIHVGKALSNVNLNIQGDDTGDNISVKNRYFCELTALYWAWKNSNADIIGLFHYRRFLNFTNQAANYNSIDGLCQKFGIDSEHIQKILMENDVILPKKTKRSLPLYDNYKKRHIGSDLEIVLSIIKNDYPAMYNTALKVLNQNYGYFANMLIAHREFFNEYCEWLFDVLFKVENQIQNEVLTRDPYQQRVYGFLSERLLTVFIEYKKQTSCIRIAEFPTLFIDEPQKTFQIVKTPNKTRWYLYGIQFFKSCKQKKWSIFYIFGIPIFIIKRR